MELMRAASVVVLASATIAFSGCGVFAGPGGTSGGSAACAEPTVVVSPGQIDPGGEVRVSGEYWGPCNDTPNDRQDPPWESVDIVWVVGSEQVALGSASLADGAFERTLRMPDSATSGDGVVRVTAPGELSIEEALVVVVVAGE